MRQWWESYHFDGDPNFVLANNLRALKEDPKKSLAMSELEKKTSAENSGAKSREELVFYLLRLDAEEKRKEKNQQNLC